MERSWKRFRAGMMPKFAINSDKRCCEGEQYTRGRDYGVYEGRHVLEAHLIIESRGEALTLRSVSIHHLLLFPHIDQLSLPMEASSSLTSIGLRGGCTR